MRKFGALLVFFAFSFGAFAQLPNKVKKMEGTWEYRFGSGLEILEVKGDELLGVGYRINQKLNDTTRVENVRMRMANKNLVYSMTTYNVIGDSVVPNIQEFVSSGRSLKFVNISAPTPHMIKYSFGFLNRNKLFIRVYHGPETKPVKLILTRKKVI
ncbi:MAG: hypothetical protein P8P74_07370 [Crocinitomicaceae bacterium]|nr:hypothetical protein [Crocinitomicaceae bacterium]